MIRSDDDHVQRGDAGCGVLWGSCVLLWCVGEARGACRERLGAGSGEEPVRWLGIGDTWSSASISWTAI